jgi:hypothetical protein
MQSRWLRVALLSFVTIWFGLIVPGHRRGQIVLPGSSRACCAKPSTGNTPERQVPLPDRGTCAVCHFMAMLDMPGAVQWDVPPMGLAWMGVVGKPQPVILAELHSASQERGPPRG